jgi:large subunit ribosomal protein L3
VSTFRGKGLLGRKVGMTSIFTEAGDQVPVTVLVAGPNTVLAVKAEGASTHLTLGFDEKREKLATRPELGVFKKAGVAPQRHVRDFKVAPADVEGLSPPGMQLGVGIFQAGQYIDVTGTSKGKGFQGVVKRHHMAGQGARGSHGTHEYHRHIGAIGQRKTPGRVFPGKRMPGHMGTDRVTVRNLAVVGVDGDNQLLLVKGAIPGHEGALVVIRPAIKPPREKKVEESRKTVNPMKASKKGGG